MCVLHCNLSYPYWTFLIASHLHSWCLPIHFNHKAVNVTLNFSWHCIVATRESRDHLLPADILHSIIQKEKNRWGEQTWSWKLRNFSWALVLLKVRFPEALISRLKSFLVQLDEESKGHARFPARMRRLREGLGLLGIFFLCSMETFHSAKALQIRAKWAPLNLIKYYKAISFCFPLQVRIENRVMETKNSKIGQGKHRNRLWRPLYMIDKADPCSCNEIAEAKQKHDPRGNMQKRK